MSDYEYRRIEFMRSRGVATWEDELRYRRAKREAAQRDFEAEERRRSDELIARLARAVHARGGR